jgi:hypothetical protein
MTAKEAIKEIKKCTTIVAVKVMLKNETRKTVLNAGEERIGELTLTENEEPKTAPAEPAKTTPDYWDFKMKIPPVCHRDKIISFAKTYFGEQFKDASYDIKTAMVTIELKNGDKIIRRGA